MRMRGVVMVAGLLALAAAWAQAGLYSDAVLADSPIGYWRLDETGGTNAPDISGGGHDGTYTNTGSITLGQAGPRPGDGFLGLEADNNAPQFAGNGHVAVPGAFLPTGGSPRAFTGWFNGTSSTNQGWLNYGQNSTPNRVSITAGPDRVAVAVSGHNFGVNGLGLGAGWHHFGVSLPTSQSNSWQFVIDGVDRTADATTLAGGTQTINTIDNTARRIGAGENGRIDEVAAFDRALAVEEIQSHYRTAQEGKLVSVLGLSEFQTAARNGASPAPTGSRVAGAPLFVRERANDSDPQLEVRAFLKFDLAEMLTQADAVSATLNLHEFNKLNNVNNAPLYIAAVTEAWDATTNLPSFGQLIDGASEFSFGTNGPANAGAAVDIDFAIDVANIVRGWQADPSSNHGLRIRIGDSFVGAAFDHTGPDAPQLVIEHIPEPTTMALLALGGIGLVVRRRRT
ncbi:DNRLRE domain-containing protein [Planctomycetota bacterium]